MKLSKTVAKETAMTNNNFKYHSTPRIGERLEMNSNGDMLKKYGGTSTSWPTHSTVQYNGQSHKQQQAQIHSFDNNVNTFFRNNF